MLPLATVSLRLTPTLLAQIDHAAAARGLTRSDWIRAALLDRLQEEQQNQELKALEKRLQVRLDELQEVIVSHVTAEIDTLTRG